VKAPAPQETGWKDTVLVPPGAVTRTMVRWAPTSTAAATPFPFDPSGRDGVTGQQGSCNYVWHCHIIDHEDNEMMRPDYVTSPASTARTYVKGVSY
jgi:FtsP/CotA-like multicopper oxidase with cupredoxin domain